MRTPTAGLDYRRVRQVLISLARSQGILAMPATQGDDDALETLDDLVQFAKGPPHDAATAARPVLVEPDERFSTKSVGDAGKMRMAVIRSAFTLTAKSVEDATRPGTYQLLALHAIELACMWAIKSVTHEPID